MVCYSQLLMQTEVHPAKAAIFATRSKQDIFAFAMIVAFIIQMYAVPGEWLEWAAPLRLALVISVASAGAFVMRRLGKMEPIYFDGLRGTAVIIFLALAIASSLWSVEPEVTRGYGIELAKLVAIYLTLLNVVNTPRRLAIACGMLVVASMVTSIGTIIWYHNGVDLSEGFRARWVGVYSDPNHMAENLGIVVPIAVAFVVRKASPRWMRLLALLGGGLAVVAIVESHSRGGFVGVSIAMIVWALREKQFRTRAVLMFGVLTAGMLIFAPKSFWERNDTLENFHTDESAMGRVYAWHVGSAISIDRPLLGVGAGAFKYAWPLYAPAEAKKAFVAHNIYVDVIGELGWVGFLFFLIFTGGASGAAFSSSDDPEVGWLARGLSAALVGYLLCNCFSGYSLSAHLYVLFALASSVDRIRRTGERLSPKPRASWRREPGGMHAPASTQVVEG